MTLKTIAHSICVMWSMIAAKDRSNFMQQKQKKLKKNTTTWLWWAWTFRNEVIMKARSALDAWIFVFRVHHTLSFMYISRCCLGKKDWKEFQVFLTHFIVAIAGERCRAKTKFYRVQTIDFWNECVLGTFDVKFVQLESAMLSSLISGVLNSSNLWKWRHWCHGIH